MFEINKRFGLILVLIALLINVAFQTTLSYIIAISILGLAAILDIILVDRQQKLQRLITYIIALAIFMLVHSLR
ncbi:hypothetical protein DCC85_10215 [Paenibacillus sp. CAA11]|nr:hypothetical protein DCC85_10215 [Paenibacillus sp. CAA11]